MSNDQSLILAATGCIGLIWLAATALLVVVVVRNWFRLRRLAGGSQTASLVYAGLFGCLALFWVGFGVVLVAFLAIAWFAGA